VVIAWRWHSRHEYASIHVAYAVLHVSSCYVGIYYWLHAHVRDVLQTCFGAALFTLGGGQRMN
jgi:hypothetical protein